MTYSRNLVVYFNSTRRLLLKELRTVAEWSPLGASLAQLRRRAAPNTASDAKCLQEQPCWNIGGVLLMAVTTAQGGVRGPSLFGSIRSVLLDLGIPVDVGGVAASHSYSFSSTLFSFFLLDNSLSFALRLQTATISSPF